MAALWALIAVSPSAGEGRGMRRGQRRGRSHRRISVSHLGNKATALGLLSVVFPTGLTKKLHVRSCF